MTRILGAVFGGCVALLLPMPTRAAEPPLTAIRETTALDKIADQLATADEMMQQKVSALLVALEAEIAATRIPSSTAESLRETARLLQAPSTGDARTILAVIRLPADNKAMMQAVNDLEREALARQISRDKLTSMAFLETRRRARQLELGARSSAEIAPFIAEVERLAMDAEKHPTAGERNHAEEDYGSLADFFQALFDGLEAGERHDPAGIVKAMKEWRKSSPAMGIVSFDEVQVVREKILSILELEIESARHDLEAAMTEWRPPPELNAALDHFQKAIDLCQGMYSYNPEYIADLYRDVVGVGIGLRTSYEPGMEKVLSKVRDDFYKLIPWVISARGVGLTNFLPSLKEAVRNASEKAEDDLREKLYAKIRRIRDSADLDALIHELEVMQPDAEPHDENNRDKSPSRGTKEWLAELEKVRSAGRTGNFGAIDASQESDLQHASAVEMKVIRGLRIRIERVALGQTLGAPELAQPPLSDMPLAAALETLYDGLERTGVWKRCLRMLELRASPAFPGITSQRSKDAAVSIRAFLGGQNFEAAEQWADAASAYKTVLRRAVERTPITEAAERIKTLKKEHPEAIAAATRRSNE